jgi:hypothetical protein
MSRRLVERALRLHGCSVLRNTGRHTVWACPCGVHVAPVPRHTTISAGVVKSIQQQMECLEEGWLQ